MEYFTRAWATGEVSEAEAERVVAAYRTYLASVDPASEVFRFANTISLNDAWVDRFEIGEDSLALRLLTGDLQRGYWLTQISYIGGRISVGLDTLEDAVRRRPTEIWYDEFSGHIPQMVHRFLLVRPSGTEARGEVHITFSDFNFTETQVTDRGLPPL